MSAVKLAGKFAETVMAFARLVGEHVDIVPIAGPLAAIVDKVQALMRAYENKTAIFDVAPIVRVVYGFGNVGAVRSNNSRVRP